ncbi:type IV secretion system DNA-binding domain-containing protein [Mucilaginibacter sabulilitoris]|uniref:Type IV secretion system DNA-binding domain-containing protein n=1 Tax=Mucilaginibacter sabulilitoris TaxID=1173583 RepID=A0ABZ0TWI7_9SPHI|nr:type IV secretory system conjugative DNA transfer family protein [Mucilaginibacter sabulilitoris]WPU97131.1 type IV secretion system DNA-binding domain-containing protein [Mucilaginibacter sabulilitoris]
MQFVIYLTLALDIFLFVYAHKKHILEVAAHYRLAFFLQRIKHMFVFKSALNSKLLILLLICLIAVGTLSRKDKDIKPRQAIIYPLSSGLFLFFGSLWFCGKNGELVLPLTSWYDIGYSCSALSGAILIHLAMDNISKIISSAVGKDKWNLEQESFMQSKRVRLSPASVNIPMLFYYRHKIHQGWINLDNIFRGTLLIGTPGAGKSFGVVAPFIRQLMAKEFTLCVYDFKYPDLARITYYHYLLARKQHPGKHPAFHVINLNEVERSRRINPLRRDFIQTLAEALETAEGLVEALKKGDKSGGGSDQFFTQSAINFLAACIYFFSRYADGKYSTLPHVLAFLNCSYEEIFNALFSEPELGSLLSPFTNAYKAKAFNQLEGQIGTLKIFISRMATKETFWVFSGDDFNLKISDPQQPGILVLANDPGTQNINSACYSLVINRLCRLINSRGNLPCGLIIDELPTLFIHRIENLIATARSNKVAVLIGLQELPQFHQQYGKETATTIAAVVGNILSGAVRNKETLEWLERLFGKVKQTGESLSIDRTKTSVSISEKMEPLIPAGKIAALKAGELVGLIAGGRSSSYNGKFESSAVNCRVNLDLKAIAQEERQYQPTPVFYNFLGKKEQVLQRNFQRINQEVESIIATFAPAKATMY